MTRIAGPDQSLDSFSSGSSGPAETNNIPFSRIQSVTHAENHTIVNIQTGAQGLHTQEENPLLGAIWKIKTHSRQKIQLAWLINGQEETIDHMQQLVGHHFDPHMAFAVVIKGEHEPARMEAVNTIRQVLADRTTPTKTTQSNFVRSISDLIFGKANADHTNN